MGYPANLEVLDSIGVRHQEMDSERTKVWVTVWIVGLVLLQQFALTSSAAVGGEKVILLKL